MFVSVILMEIWVYVDIYYLRRYFANFDVCHCLGVSWFFRQMYESIGEKRGVC